eukprot:s4341_g4.t1
MRRAKILAEPLGSGDHEVDVEVWNQTLDECAKGWLRGPLPSWDVPEDAPISKRFGLRQRHKNRLIDDITESSVNQAVSVFEAPVLHTVDVACSSVSHFFTVSGGLGLPCDLEVRTFDLSSAYRQIALNSEGRKMAYIRVFNPESGQWALFQEGRKCIPFSPSCEALGVIFDLSCSSTGDCKISNTAARIPEIKTEIERILGTGWILQVETQKLRGRMQFADSQIYGRAGKRRTRTLRDFACRRRSKISEKDAKFLKLFVQLLEDGGPRKVTADLDEHVVILTDACYERDARELPWGLGEVFLDPTTGKKQFFSCALDESKRALLGEQSKEQIIFEVETLRMEKHLKYTVFTCVSSKFLGTYRSKRQIWWPHPAMSCGCAEPYAATKATNSQLILPIVKRQNLSFHNRKGEFQKSRGLSLPTAFKDKEEATSSDSTEFTESTGRERCLKPRAKPRAKGEEFRYGSMHMIGPHCVWLPPWPPAASQEDCSDFSDTPEIATVVTEAPEEPAPVPVPVGDYHTAAEQLPPCPPHLLRLGRRLVAGDYSVEYRIKRAWEAGYWASLAMDLSVEAGGDAPVRAVLTWPPEEGAQQHSVQVFVIMRRPGGVLLAMPENIVEDFSLRDHAQPRADGLVPLVGPYRTFSVPLLVTGEDGLLVGSEEMCNVLVVDMSFPGVEEFLSPFSEDAGDLDLVNHFINTDPGARPSFPDLLAQVSAWVAEELGERLTFYSAQEEEEEDVPTPARRRDRSQAGVPVGSTPPAKAPGVAKAGGKKPTVATLAAQMETILSTLPALTQQLAAVTERQNAMDRASPSSPPLQPPFRPIAATRASQPVSSLLHARAVPRPTDSLDALVGPPPASRHVSWESPIAQQVRLPEDEPYDPLNAAGEMGDQSPMAMAILEQSKALRALMVHFHTASSDPMSDLSSSGPTTGVKGTMAREKLQRELATGSGQFYLRVCQSIRRRMAPASKTPSSLSEARGTSLLEYLERYGGFGQNRELGMVQWSIAHAFDAAAREEWGAVQDHLALTAVMVEQASLDNNRWHLAWLLRLLDDPPQNLWLNRSQTATGARRPFAPLCSPSWATTALAYMKEAEVLQTKRQELLGAKPAGTSDGTPSAKPNPKRKPGKGKGKQSNQQDQTQEEG